MQGVHAVDAGAWLEAILISLGVIGQWGVGAYYAGKLTQRVTEHGHDLLGLHEDVRELRGRVDNHEGRMSAMEGFNKGVRSE